MKMNHCNLSPLLGVLGKKWTTHIIATFFEHEELSFGDIRRYFPSVTATTITLRLKELRIFGLIEKTDTGTYRATNKLFHISKILELIETGN